MTSTRLLKKKICSARRRLQRKVVRALTNMLQSLFNRPPLTSDLLVRESLLSKLQEAMHLPLTVVSAPAGYGKSVTISQWLERVEYCKGWLTLDESLNDLPTFLRHIIEAVHQQCPGVFARAGQLAQNAGLMTAEALSEQLINEINSIDESFVLVLDDYHTITNKEIHDLISALLRHPSGYLHLVIITRRDPPIDIKRLRLHRQLLNLRAADLAFSRDEFLEFLQRSHQDMSTSEVRINQFYDWTEGWILGIRLFLAANSFRELDLARSSPFYNGEGGSLSQNIRFVIDQLNENLAPNLVELLGLAACCDRFNARLLRDLFEFADHAGIRAELFIQKLRDQNLFLIPLDDNQEWWRFHHLYRDLLRKEWLSAHPEKGPKTFRFISQWFAGEEKVEEAIQYAVLAQDYQLAATLILDNRKHLREEDRWWTMQRWLSLVPESVQRADRHLLFDRLWVQEQSWEISNNGQIIHRLAHLSDQSMTPTESAELDFHRCHNALFLHSDPAQAEILARQSEAASPEDERLTARRQLVLSVAQTMLGRGTEASQALKELQDGYSPDAIIHLRSYIAQLSVLLLMGQFDKARSVAEQFLFLAEDCPFQSVEAWSHYLSSNVHFQKFDLQQLQACFDEALRYQEQLNLRATFDGFAGLVISAGLLGQTERAWSALRDMKLLQQRIKGAPFDCKVKATEARLNCLLGDADACTSWLDEPFDCEYKPVDPLFQLEHPALTRCRVLIACGGSQQVNMGLQLLDAFEDATRSVHNEYHRIDTSLIRALAHHRERDDVAAQIHLREALRLYDEQRILRPLVEMAKTRQQLFDLVEESELPSVLRQYLTKRSSDTLPKMVKETEWLSQRELQIVRMIAEGMRNKEIAGELFLTVGTIKSHLTNIYKKLQVSNRTTMLRRAKELGMLTTTFQTFL